MANGGKREGAGRPKGAVNKKTQLIEEILESLNCRPLEILARIAKGEPTYQRVGLNTAGDDYTEGEFAPTLDQRISAAKELASYAYPKRKAVEHTGPQGGPVAIAQIQIQPVKPV